MLCATPGSQPCSTTPYPKIPHLRHRHLSSTRLRTSACLAQPNGAKVEHTPWLIVGLGNPGHKYHATRHNAGFEMIDRISEAQGIVMNTIQSKSLIGIGSIGNVPLLLAKPQAYMNFSGEAVGPLAAYYQVPLRHILLVYDEMNLPNGVLRLQPKGGHGHHNGVKSVIEHLDGCREFPRFCIGIGNPPGTMDFKAFLLQKFSVVERQQIDGALEQGVDAVRTLVSDGFSKRITRFNLGQKYKYNKPYQSGYKARPARPEDVAIDISGGWIVDGNTVDLNDPLLLVMASLEQHFLDAEYDEYVDSSASRSTIVYVFIFIYLVYVCVSNLVKVSRNLKLDELDGIWLYFLTNIFKEAS